MKYALYPGCTVLGRGRNYEIAARAVADPLGIEFVDSDDFECCGFPIKSVHRATYTMMAARNILSAEDKQLDICTLCSACTGTLIEVNNHLIRHFDEKAHIVAQLRKNGIHYHLGHNITIKHFAKVLYEDVGLDNIARFITRSLSPLKIAAHYGCHYIKPTEIYSDPEDPENPHSLDDLIMVTGAQSIQYDHKLECCGAGILALNEHVAYSVAEVKLKELAHRGVDALVLVCPFCSVMYDDNQRKIGEKFQEDYGIPVLYYPQLLGLAMGMDAKTLGLRMNRVSTKPLLEKVGAL